MTQPAGWYPDPSGQGQQYWDGTQWLAPAAQAGIYAVQQPAPLSEKSAMAAGLFQLFFGWFGIGRFYVGSTAIGFIQLAIGIIGIVSSIVLVGFFILGALSIWTFIDAMLMFAGAVRDGDGRKLR